MLGFGVHDHVLKESLQMWKINSNIQTAENGEHVSGHIYLVETLTCLQGLLRNAYMPSVD